MRTSRPTNVRDWNRRLKGRKAWRNARNHFTIICTIQQWRRWRTKMDVENERRRIEQVGKKYAGNTKWTCSRCSRTPNAPRSKLPCEGSGKYEMQPSIWRTEKLSITASSSKPVNANFGRSPPSGGPSKARSLIDREHQLQLLKQVENRSTAQKRWGRFEN